jgi:hypothetical protein
LNPKEANRNQKKPIGNKKKQKERKGKGGEKKE